MRAIDRIHRLALDAGIPERQIRKTLAGICGISVQAVGQWYSTTGRISPEFLVAIAKEFRTTVEFLVTGNGAPAGDSAAPLSLPPLLRVTQLRDWLAGSLPDAAVMAGRHAAADIGSPTDKGLLAFIVARSEVQTAAELPAFFQYIMIAPGEAAPGKIGAWLGDNVLMVNPVSRALPDGARYFEAQGNLALAVPDNLRFIGVVVGLF